MADRPITKEILLSQFIDPDKLIENCLYSNKNNTI